MHQCDRTENRPPRRLARSAVAVLIGLAGSVLIWIVSPYSSFLLMTGSPVGGYLPVGPLFVLLLLLLVLNPLLSRWGRQWMLNRTQLAIVLGILLIASVIPGQGVMKMLPYSLAKAPLSVSQNQRLADAYREAQVRQVLFPDRIDGSKDVPASEHFLTSRPPGQSIPWEAWIGPLWSWGLLFLFGWVMLICLALIVVPQWRLNERLPFPLLALQQTLIESPGDGHCVPPLFRARSFWIAAGAVFLLHLLKGFHAYNPESVPVIPLDWNLSNLFTEGPLRFLPYYMKESKISFLILGVAFFMPSRVGFSIWFFTVAYAMYIVVGTAYIQPFSVGTIADHRTGAMFAVSLGIVWLGRLHWVHVGRCMCQHVKSDADHLNRWAGWGFLLGSGGMFVWLIWMGRVQPWWALFFVVIAVLSGLLITRLVAETGIPTIRLDMRYSIPLVKVIGAHLGKANALWMLSPASLYFMKVMVIFFVSATIASPAALAAHAVQLDEGSVGYRRLRYGLILVLVLVIGLVISGAAHLHMNYRHSSSLDGVFQPINAWGMKHLAQAGNDLLRRQDAQFDIGTFNDPDRWDLGLGHLAFGTILAAVLFGLCHRSPLWPLHPIGLVVVHTNFTGPAAVSIFLGWLLKVLVLRYGGVALFRLARPVVFGLIVGDVLSRAFWIIEPAIRLWTGQHYQTVL